MVSTTIIEREDDGDKKEKTQLRVLKELFESVLKNHTGAMALRRSVPFLCALLFGNNCASGHQELPQYKKSTHIRQDTGKRIPTNTTLRKFFSEFSFHNLISIQYKMEIIKNKKAE